jgi:hypothetical protein
MHELAQSGPAESGQAERTYAAHETIASKQKGNGLSGEADLDWSTP